MLINQIFIDDSIITLFDKVVNPDMFNADNKVVLFDKGVKPETFMMILL
jgi:hypothetical protein